MFRRAQRPFSGGRLLWLLLLVITIALSSPALGHDLYLEPSSFEPRLGQPIAIAIGVGHAFAGAPLPYTGSLIDSFTVTAPNGDQHQLGGVEGVHPAALYRFDQAGVWNAVYDGAPWIQSLPPERFEAYLAEVGRLDLAVTIQSDEPVLERVHRCARTLIKVGGEKDRRTGTVRQTATCGFDIVPVSTPNAPGAFTARVLRHGKSAAGVRVLVWSENEGHSNDLIHGHPQILESDPEGLVQLDFSEPGRFVLASVEVAPAAEGSPDGARFESSWATLSLATNAAGVHEQQHHASSPD